MLSNHRSMPRARKAGLIVQPLDGETLVYDAERDVAHDLNPTAALVYKYCDGKRSAGEIAQCVAAATRRPVSEEVVWYALQQLDRYHLLETPPVLPATMSRMTRREFITKFALAAAVVPVIKTFKVSGPLQGASCGGAGASCATDGDCCPGLVCCAPSNPTCQLGC